MLFKGASNGSDPRPRFDKAHRPELAKGEVRGNRLVPP
jgi:hypothetical protein